MVVVVIVVGKLANASMGLVFTILICRYYNMKVRKSPHVVGHYAAGARLIGLTEKQMAKHLATLNVTGGQNNDSPYAQPLCMFTSNLPSNIKRMTRTHGKIRLTVVVKTQDDEKKDKDDGGSMEKESTTVATEIVSLVWLITS